MACGRFFNAPVPSGCTLRIALSKGDRLQLERDDLLMLQLGEDPVEHARLAPTVIRV